MISDWVGIDALISGWLDEYCESFTNGQFGFSLHQALAMHLLIFLVM